MRSPFLLSLAFALAACGGASGGDSPEEPSTTEGPSASDSATPGASGPVTTECPDASRALVTGDGTIARPAGSALRLSLVYQGSSIGVTEVRGVDMILRPSVGPFVPGTNAGYWAETRDARGAALYTRLLQDPTRVEVAPAPGTKDWTNQSLPRCMAKRMELDVPNDANARSIVVFGSPYGTQDGAVEIGRFSIE